MQSHPGSYNCPFTLLFLLPSEPIWLIGHKWGHLCTKPLKLGDYLLTGEFPSEAPAVGPDSQGAECGFTSTAAGPRFTFSLFVLLASLEGYARSTACLPPTPGFPGANAPSLLCRHAAGLQSSHCGLGVASSAPLPRCSSSSAPRPFPCPPSYTHQSTHCPKTRARSWTTSKRTGLPQRKWVCFSHNCRINGFHGKQSVVQ